MATRIRLQRLGRRNLPFYRIAVMDSRTRRDGKYIEKLGYYDPLVKDPAQQAKVAGERVLYWIGQGAIPSPKVTHILRRCGVELPAPRSRTARRRKKKGAGSGGA